MGIQSQSCRAASRGAGGWRQADVHRGMYAERKKTKHFKGIKTGLTVSAVAAMEARPGTSRARVSQQEAFLCHTVHNADLRQECG